MLKATASPSANKRRQQLQSYSSVLPLPIRAGHGGSPSSVASASASPVSDMHDEDEESGGASDFGGMGVSRSAAKGGDGGEDEDDDEDDEDDETAGDSQVSALTASVVRKERLAGALQSIDDELAALRDGGHELLQADILAAEMRYKEILESAEDVRRRRQEHADMLHTVEVDQAQEELETLKVSLRERLMDQLLKKRKRVESGVLENGMTTRKKGRAADAAAAAALAAKGERTLRTMRLYLSHEEISGDLSLMRKSPELGQAIMSNVWAENGKLHYHGSTFVKFQRINCEFKDVSFPAVVSQVEEEQLHVQQPNGIEVRIWVDHLRSGDWKLYVV